MQYSEVVKTHFFEPKNILSQTDQVGDQMLSVSRGQISLGDAATLYVVCQPGSKVIEQLKFKVYGNPYLIAGLSYLTEMFVGSSLSEVEKKLSANLLIEQLAMPPTKHYVAYFIEDLFRELIQEWRKKHEQ